MKDRLVRRAVLAAGILALTATAYAQGGRSEARAEVKDAQGKGLGQVTLVQHPYGVLLRGELSGLPEGWHAVHVHTTGKCEPTFQAAGGHFNPAGVKHGLDAGPHAGDLPNIYASADGTAKFEIVSPEFSIAGPPAMAAGGPQASGGHQMSGAHRMGPAPAVLDADGASIVVHAKTDDYRTDPAGDSGDRIACGVIERR